MEDLADTLQKNQEEKAKKEKEKQEKEAQKMHEEATRKQKLEEEEIRKLEEQERIEEQRLLEEKQRLEEKERLEEKRKLDNQKRLKKKQQQKKALEMKALEEQRVLKEQQQLEFQRLLREQQFIESERRLRAELTSEKKLREISPTKPMNSPIKASKIPAFNATEEMSNNVRISALPSGFKGGEFNPYLEDWGEDCLMESLTLNENKLSVKVVQKNNFDGEPQSWPDTVKNEEAQQSKHQPLRAPLKQIAPLGLGQNGSQPVQTATILSQRHNRNNITSVTNKPFSGYNNMMPNNKEEEDQMLQTVLRESLGTDKSYHHSNGVTAMDEVDDVDVASHHKNGNSDMETITDERFNLQYGAKPKTTTWHSNLQNQQTLGSSDPSKIFGTKSGVENRSASNVTQNSAINGVIPVETESIWDYSQQNPIGMGNTGISMTSGFGSSYYGNQNFQPTQSHETPKKQNPVSNRPAYHNHGNQNNQQQLSHHFGSERQQQQHGIPLNSNCYSPGGQRDTGQRPEVLHQNYVTNQQSYANKLRSPPRHSQAHQQQQHHNGAHHQSYHNGNQRRDLTTEFNLASQQRGQGHWNTGQPQLLRFASQIPSYEVLQPMTFYNSLYTSQQQQNGIGPFVTNLPNPQYRNF